MTVLSPVPSDRRLCPDISFFQRATEYPCLLILDPQNEFETLRKRVEQTTLKSQTVARNRSGVTNVRGSLGAPGAPHDHLSLPATLWPLAPGPSVLTVTQDKFSPARALSGKSGIKVKAGCNGSWGWSLLCMKEAGCYCSGAGSLKSNSRRDGSIDGGS